MKEFEIYGNEITNHLSGILLLSHILSGETVSVSRYTQIRVRKGNP